MRASLTPDDLKKADPLPPIPPGWYPLEIVKYDEAVTKGSDEKPSDGSTNSIFFFKVLDGPGKDRELRRYINEKSLHWGKSLYAALGFPKNASGGYDVSTELFQQTIGHKVMGYIKRDKGSAWDGIEDFKPMS